MNLYNTKSSNSSSSRLHTSNKIRAAILPIVACTVMVLLLITLFFIYTSSLSKMVKEENYRYLHEISAQIESNMTVKLNSHYSKLKIIGNEVNRTSNTSLASILSVLDEERESNSYISLALIDEDGYLHSINGKILYHDLLPFIGKMNNESKNVTSSILNLDGNDSIVFLSPFTQIRIDDITFRGVAAISDIDRLSNALSLTMFDNQGFAHVVTETGTIVIRAENPNNKFTGYNILTYLENETSLSKKVISNIRVDLLEGMSGQFEYVRDDGTEFIAFYSPSKQENWYLISLIPSEVITKQTSEFFKLTVTMCSVLVVIFVVLIIVILASNQRRKRELINVLYIDTVTNGRSKLKFEEDASRAIKGTSKQYSLVYINIDKFKLINELHGRVKADTLLAQIYNIIDNSISKENNEYIGRLMADHYGVLLHTQNLEAIKDKIREWNESIKRFVYMSNLAIPVRIMCGVYLPDDDDIKTDIFVMLDKANTARKAAFTRDSNATIAVYDADLKQKVRLEHELELRQESALKNGEFKMYLQPKYDPKTNEIAGAEGLTRWITDDGVVYPDQFIPLFEANGFILKLDLYIFEEACKFIDNLVRNSHKPLPISINLSRRNLSTPNFIEKYVEIWKKYNFPANLLEFEITESLIYENMELLDKTIATIHEYGFLVSMDDFGSGYSSLNMLKSVNVDFVKLDREFFLSNEQYAQKGEIIINAMIELCRELGICVVSEGIENESQVEFLRRVGCNLIQGYYYAKPMPKEELLTRIIQNSEDETD